MLPKKGNSLSVDQLINAYFRKKRKIFDSFNAQ